jgi:hypothetical protein
METIIKLSEKIQKKTQINGERQCGRLHILRGQLSKLIYKFSKNTIKVKKILLEFDNVARHGWLTPE